MLEELKRCNYLGDPSAIYSFASIAIVPHVTYISDVIALSSSPGYGNVKQKACLDFFEALGLIEVREKQIFSTGMGIETIKKRPKEFHSTLSKLSIDFLIGNGFLNIEALSYDPTNNISTIRKSGFALQMAVIRNYLIAVHALKEFSPGLFSFVGEFQEFFEDGLRRQRKKISLEQLIAIHEVQEKQGRLAEEYVVAFEKKRLLWGNNAEKVKQISDFDVSAGYDIVSCNSAESVGIDRYIEVKSFHTTPSFYWSENEVSTAKRFGKDYFLYLVDMEKFRSTTYEPIVIQNPYSEIFSLSDNWILEVASTKITKV